MLYVSVRGSRLQLVKSTRSSACICRSDDIAGSGRGDTAGNGTSRRLCSGDHCRETAKYSGRQRFLCKQPCPCAAECAAK